MESGTQAMKRQDEASSLSAFAVECVWSWAGKVAEDA